MMGYPVLTLELRENHKILDALLPNAALTRYAIDAALQNLTIPTGSALR